jgi:phage tail-like protein
VSFVIGTREYVPSPDGHLSANGHLPTLMEQRSTLLDYLPAIFSEGEDASFIGRYLMIFETILNSVDNVITHLPDYFAAETTPESFLPWLASWIGLTLDENWPLERRRAVLANAMELHRRRGTIGGLTDHILLYTGIKPTIEERGSGLKLGKQNRLGHQTVLGRGDRPHHFSVILRVPDPETIDRARLRTIIEAQRPAHTSYALFVVPIDEDESVAGAEPIINQPEPATSEGETA